jgi:uncharacterized DUF497 family protein
MHFDDFDWDDGNTAKCQKHGVTLTQIEELLTGRFGLHPDVANSTKETRFRAIGAIESGRWIFCVITFRRMGAWTLIRPISARFMHAPEIAYYEKETARSDK